ncbi:MAG TPA: metalloregulator ArsR/SmtB family transcription factor [Patescibacteria group bacterium]
MPTINEIERKARIFALFGDPTRLRILNLLSRKKTANVSEIAKEVEMSVACVSHHLQLLKDNAVVDSKRKGNNIYYQLIYDPLVKNLQSLVK